LKARPESALRVRWDRSEETSSLTGSERVEIRDRKAEDAAEAMVDVERLGFEVFGRCHDAGIHEAIGRFRAGGGAGSIRLT
jgi:hypothetical protein